QSSSKPSAVTENVTLSLHDALPILLDFGCGGVATQGVVKEHVDELHIALAAAHVAVAVIQEGFGHVFDRGVAVLDGFEPHLCALDRKSTRLNSSHVKISYAVFCLKK